MRLFYRVDTLLGVHLVHIFSSRMLRSHDQFTAPPSDGPSMDERPCVQACVLTFDALSSLIITQWKSLIYTLHVV